MRPPGSHRVARAAAGGIRCLHPPGVGTQDDGRRAAPATGFLAVRAIGSESSSVSVVPGLRGAIERLRERGDALPLSALAAELLALRLPPAPALARRVVAAALGARPAALSDPLDLRLWDVSALDPELAAPDTARALPLAAAEFVVVDLETTGLAHATSTILEIGAVRIAGGCAVERFTTLVNPGMPVPAAITALTGIDDLLVRRAPPLGPAVAAFAGWLARHPAAPFVAHNAGFDEGFVSRALDAHGLPPLARPVLCTRKLARRIVPELRRYGLDRLAAHYGVGFGGAALGRHRALGDAQVTAEVLLRLLARVQEDPAVRTLGDLLDLQARKPPARAPQPAPASRPSGVFRPPWVAST